MRFLLPGLFLLLCLGLGEARGQALGAGFGGNEPISITADRLEADEGLREVRFIGEVVVRQADVAIYADRILLVYPEEGREIERVEATGDVRIVQGDRVAHGEKAVFYNRERKIVLTGAPRVYQGDDFLEGDEIVVLLDEEKSIVRGSQGSRVNAVFHPRGEQR